MLSDKAPLMHNLEMNFLIYILSFADPLYQDPIQNSFRFSVSNHRDQFSDELL